MAEKVFKKENSSNILDNARKLPRNIEAEQSVLCCMLLDNNAAIYISQQLKEDAFFSEAHRVIYRAMNNILSKPDINNVLDVITLTDELERMGELKKAGGVEYIAELSSFIPVASNYRKYAEIVRDKALLRKVIDACSNAVNSAYENEDAYAVLAETEATLYTISKEEERNELMPAAEITPAVLKRIDDLKDPNYRLGIPTGLKAIDRILNGLHKSDLVLLAARPGIGKTALAMNIIANMTMREDDKNPVHCAVFNLEMSREQLVQRLICSVAKVSMEKSLRGTLDAEEWRRVMAATQKIDRARLYIDDTSYIKPQDILNKCLRLRKEKGLDIIMIDYLQLITPNRERNESRAQEVAEITRFLKITAKELNVPILLLSQLSRKSEERSGRPMLSDLRESGAIEQDADIVMFLHKDKKDADVYQEIQEYDLIVAKHRNGKLDTSKLLFNAPQVRFYDDEAN